MNLSIALLIYQITSNLLTDEPFQVEFIPRIQQLTSAILNPFFKLD
jgi:hypothetical protein